MMSARNAFRFLGFLGMLGLAAGAQAQWEDEEDPAEDDLGGEESADAEYNPEEGDVSGPEPEPMTDGGGAGKSPVAVTVGVKFGVGGNYLPAPDKPAGASYFFDDGVGGVGFGGGFYSQARVLDGLLGLELGFIFDSSNNWSKYTLNGNDFEPAWTTLEMRMPLLFSVGTPGEGTRVSFGTGPEFAFPLSASTEAPGPFPTTGTVATETHVNWLINLGLAVPVSVVKVSFDLRFGYNLGLPSNNYERASGSVPSYYVLAEHALDLRLLLGVGYDLPF